jgi:2-dehydropantoate 2-reductase
MEAANHNLPFIKDCPILTMQNGVRADQLLSRIVPPQNIIGSVVMFGATYIGPGEAVHNFEGDLTIGRVFGVNDGQIGDIAHLTGLVFTTHISEYIKGMKWLKVFINLNNCLPALIGKSMQETFKNLRLCEVSIGLLNEGLELVDKAGIKLGSLPTFPEERLRDLVSMALDKSTSLFSQVMSGLSKEPLYGSILQSIQRKRPSEFDYINGEIVALGERIGVPAPLNKKIVNMVHQVEKTEVFFTPDEVLREMRI